MRPYEIKQPKDKGGNMEANHLDNQDKTVLTMIARCTSESPLHRSEHDREFVGAPMPLSPIPGLPEKWIDCPVCGTRYWSSNGEFRTPTAVLELVK